MPTSIDIHKIATDIEAQRKRAEAAKLRFTGLTEPQLGARLLARRAGMPVPAALPMIVWQGWSGAAAPGGTIHYNFGILNPSASETIWLFAHAFVGPANFVSDPGAAVQAVDPRFARLTEPAFPGLSIAAGATATLSFEMPVPARIEASNYMGNTFLFRADWHDVGAYLDRGFWPFAVGPQ